MSIELTPFQDARILDMLDHNLTVFKIIMAECERQSADANGVLRLAQAYLNARRNAKHHKVPQLDHVLSMAASIEPATKGQLRDTPVSFANGGSAPSADSVRYAITHLFDILTEFEGNLDPDEVCRTFESIHPFIDGNGRIAWLIRVWLTDTWNNPQRLPIYSHA